MSVDGLKLLNRWLKTKRENWGVDKLSYDDLDNLVSNLYWSWTDQKEMLENGRDDKEHRRLIKCRNCEGDFIRLDLEFGPIEEDD